MRRGDGPGRARPLRFPFVLLDAGETLIGPRRSYGAVYAEVLGGLGLELDAERLTAAIRSTAAEIQADLAPGTDRYGRFPGGEQAYWQHFVRRVLALAADREPEDAFVRRCLDPLREAFRGIGAWRVYDDVVPVLDTLRNAGCRLAVVSNWDSRLPRLLERLGIADRFETLGVSHLEGVEKPDPRLFRKVLARLGARPDQALHVGNVPAMDAAGAEAAGITARLVDRTGALAPHYGAWPDLVPLPDTIAG